MFSNLKNSNKDIFGKGAGRPVKRESGQKRNKKVIINFTEEELELLEIKINKTDYNRSEFIRFMVLGEDSVK
jgi:hypothetical protein